MYSYSRLSNVGTLEITRSVMFFDMDTKQCHTGWIWISDTTTKAYTQEFCFSNEITVDRVVQKCLAFHLESVNRSIKNVRFYYWFYKWRGTLWKLGSEGTCIHWQIYSRHLLVFFMASPRTYFGLLSIVQLDIKWLYIYTKYTDCS